MENENRVAIISMIIDKENIVVADAPADKISALSGKLGRLRGVTSKAVYSPQREKTGEETKEG